MADTADVRDNPAATRYELDVEGQTAFLDYRRAAGAVDLRHTEVPEALRGRGLANVLVKRALDDARAAGLAVVPTCPVVRAYVRRHPEYLPLLHH
jgi:predicted GNAT family acetyltransferase